MGTTGAACTLWFVTLLLGAPIVVDGVDVTYYSVPQLWAKSDEYYHAGDYLRSIHILRRVVEMDPTDVEAYSVAAWLIWSLGDEPAARQWLHSSAKANPKNWQAANDLGLHYYQRLNAPSLALPWLIQAEALPDRPETVPRTLAHALADADQPWLAAEVWSKLTGSPATPPAMIENNRAKARQLALRSDLQVLGGGAIEGPPLLGEAPLVLAERRSGRDAEGYATERVVDLGAPGSRELIGRITYEAYRSGLHRRWRWRTMTGDANGNGSLDDDPVLSDTDDDGIAEALPPLAELRRLRSDNSSMSRRLVAPDRYEIGVGDDGQPAAMPLEPDGAKLRLAPPIYLACSEGTLTFRAVLRETATYQDVLLRPVPLPHGTMVVNRSGATAVLLLDAAQIKAGRYVVAAEILREGLVVDRKQPAEWVVVSDGTRLTVGQPKSEDAQVWQGPPTQPNVTEPPNEQMHRL